MIVLDAYAVVAFLKDEPAAAEVAALLDRDDCRLTAVGLAEVIDHLGRVVGVDAEDVALDLAELGLLEPLPVDAGIGMAAGMVRAARYHRTRCAVSMADCIAAETARRWAAPLATSDPHLLDVCHTEGIDVCVLADSSGATWAPG